MISFAKKGALFIAKMTKSSGKLIYQFDIKTGKSFRKYNMLRHFGCIYAMLSLYAYSNEKEKSLLKKSSQNALSWAMKKKVVEIDNNFTILEKGKIKLGANALAIFAFSKWMSIFGDKDLFEGYFPSQILIKLGTYLLKNIEDDGNLKFHKFDFETKQIDDFKSNFYPGEIMLAFCMLSELTEEISASLLIDSAISIMQWLRDHRDRNEQTRDHWQLQAMAKLYYHKLVSNKMKKYILKYAKRIAKVEPITPERFNSVPSGPIAARTEGLIAYYNIKQEKWALREIEKNINRLKEFQIKSGKYRGGFRYLIDDPETRIDHSQHGSLAFLEYWKIKNEKD